MSIKFLEEIQKNETIRKRLAKKMAHDCFRNSKLEYFHADPESRLSDAEMKELMIDVVNNCYDFIFELFGPHGKDIVNWLKEKDPMPQWYDPYAGE